MDNRRALASALVITSVIFLVELAGGFISNSLALLSDAGHMFTDILALLLALLAAVFALLPAGKKRTYGFYRLEILAALINGSLLTLVALFIFYHAYQRFIHPAEVWSGMMLTVATIGFAANLGAAVILAKSSRDNLNVRAAFLHVLSDLTSSVGVIAGGLIILITRWYYIDSILGVIIGILILRGALSLVFDAVNILLEATPKGIELEDVMNMIKGFAGVKEVHDLHVWTITSGLNAISAHILIDDSAAENAPKLLEEIKRALNEKFQIAHSTFQTECEACPEGMVCRLDRSEREHGHRH